VAAVCPGGRPVMAGEVDQAWTVALETFARTGNYGGVESGVADGAARAPAFRIDHQLGAGAEGPPLRVTAPCASSRRAQSSAANCWSPSAQSSGTNRVTLHSPRGG
jgi:hypothetical protein